LTELEIKMKAFDKKNLKALRTEIDVALKALGEKHGITLHAGNASFTSEKVTFKLEVTVNDADGSTQTPESIALKSYYPGLVDKVVTVRGGNATVVGYMPRRYKYPFLVRMTNGKEYAVTSRTVNA
jgi:hypothetical protein